MTAGPAFGAAFRAELLELLRWRRDVRHFRADPVDPALLHQLLATAALAPSVGLSQPWRFVLVESAAARAAVRTSFAAANAEALAATGRPGLYARLKLAGLDEAPCQLAAFAEPDPAQGGGLGRRTMPETAEYSVAVAVHTLWLAARAHGLGLGWVSILHPAAVGAALDVPRSWRLVAYLCLGYPADEHDAPELERQGWELRQAGPVLLTR